MEGARDGHEAMPHCVPEMQTRVEQVEDNTSRVRKATRDKQIQPEWRNKPDQGQHGHQDKPAHDQIETCR